MSYLLDTCTISQFIRGNKGVLKKLKNIEPKNINISSITIMEIEYGLCINPQRAIKIRDIVSDLLNTVKIIQYSQSDAKKTGEIRAILKAQGTPIGAYDVMLAGCAKQRELIFVTDNIK